MYVDLVLLFLIYSFSVIALGVSVYALWTLKEVEQHLRDQRNKKARSAWNNYHAQPPAKTTRPKGHWG